MKNKIFFWSITVALAGFLFGFDTVVISGADIELQKLWDKGDLFHGFVIMSSALWGTVIGAFFGSYPTDKIGRKKTLIWIGVLYTISALGSALVSDPWLFSFFRLLGGLGVGASTIAAPAYISEISPPSKRGRLVALYQFNIVLGILIAFLSNYLISLSVGEGAWRWMIGVEAIPAILYTLMVLGVPESPRWLILSKNAVEEAKQILTIIDRSVDPTHEVKKILASNQASVNSEHIFLRKYRFPVGLAFLIALFNQFSGINALLYYAPRIFETAGLGQSTSLLSSAGIGATNLIFTLIGLSLIDRLGRRQLMFAGSIGYIISLFLVGFFFSAGVSGMAVPIFLFIFIAAHAVGQGTVIWVFISEIFPNHLRANGQALGSSTHWVLAAIIPSLIPFLFSSIGPAPVFYFFGFMMVLQLIFVWRMMPETKGVPLEELQKKLVPKSLGSSIQPTANEQV